jgi:hypothetical protein
MSKFLTIFLPVAIFATGVLWLLVRSLGLTQDAPDEIEQALQVAPFVLGPLLSAMLTLSLLRLVSTHKKTEANR